MSKYIIKRILIAIPVLIGITVIDYGIMCLAGSPLAMLQGPRVSEAAKEVREIALGLDKPFYIQYLVWLGQLLKGNMGYSIKSYQPVSAMIASHLGPTLLLMGASLAVSLIMAVPAGIYSAVHQYSKGDYTVVTFSFLGSSIPGFFLSLLLIYLFTVKLGWLPSGGMITLGTDGGALDVARHMVMPVLVLAFSMAGSNIRYIRSAVLEILQQDYLRTARAKGIGRFRVIYKHALRNALVPIVTVIGMEIPMLFGGAVIIEQVFSWPGLGLMTMSAITSRDYPVIMGVCLLSAVVVLAANLITDILYALVDPTIQLNTEERMTEMQLKTKKDKDIISESYLQTVFRRFRRHHLAMASLVVLVVLGGAALFAPLLAPYDPDAIIGPFGGAPSRDFLLGTDQIGRDVLSRLLYAMRISLLVGIMATLISTVIGVVLGLVGGYFGGALDMVIMRFTDMVMSFPYILLVLVAASIFKPGLWSIILILGFVDWPGIARLVRGNVLNLRETNFVKGSLVAGMPLRHILFSEILPNTVAPILVYATSVLALSMLDEAALSFLGMGVQPPTASLGNMLNGAESLTVLTKQPWLWLPPGILIVVLVMAINFIGDALRDALDPNSRG